MAESEHAKGIADAYRGVKDAFNGTTPSAPRPAISGEVRDRVNSDLDRVIEHWHKQSQSPPKPADAAAD